MKVSRKAIQKRKETTMRLTCKLLGACALMLAFAGTTVHAQDSYPSSRSALSCRSRPVA
jgi:hypothetical protein